MRFVQPEGWAEQPRARASEARTCIIFEAFTHNSYTHDAAYANDNMARYLLWLQALLSVAIAAQLYTCAAGQYHTEVSRALPDTSSAIAYFLI